MGIHLLHCAHSNERIKTHDEVYDICRNAWFHMGWKQLHVLTLTMFNPSRQWVNIVFTKDGIRTLVDVIIADPTCVDLLIRSCKTQGCVAFDATQTTKKVIAINTPLIDSSI